MKLNIKVFSLLLLLCAASCTSYKKVPYFQEAGNPVEFETPSYSDRSVVRFQPDDVLAITVNVPNDQKVAAEYNLPIQPSATTFEGEGAAVDQGVGRQTYLISKNGEIDFPNLGAIKAVGYTQEELQEYIKKLLRGRMKIEPVVTVRLMNFRILMIGEVNRPGQITINRDRVDLFEAISLAGDLTVFGKRENVLIRRQLPDGTFKYVKLDISKAEVSASPYFYLRQNDMVYVQPTKAKTLQSDVSLWGIITGVATFAMGLITYITVYRK